MRKIIHFVLLILAVALLCFGFYVAGSMRGEARAMVAYNNAEVTGVYLGFHSKTVATFMGTFKPKNIPPEKDLSFDGLMWLMYPSDFPNIELNVAVEYETEELPPPKKSPSPSLRPAVTDV